MENKAKKLENTAEEQNKIKKIIGNYKYLEEEIVNQLNFDCEHPTTIGTFREEVWKSMFERIIPKKFSIERSVFIIDSYGKISKEVDLAIFDENYTPYIFKYGQLKFIPIEAVAAVIECKSTDVTKSKIEPWANSIDELKTSNESIVRLANSWIDNTIQDDNKNKQATENKKQTTYTQTHTRPIKILCCISTKGNIGTNFDIIISVKKANKNCKKSNQGSLKVEYIYKEEKNDLSYWYNQLNHYKSDESDKKIRDVTCTKTMDNYKVYKENVKGNCIEEVTLLSFVFQFNQLLMIINNPLFFPHLAYAEMFNKHLNLEVKSE